VQLTVDIGNSRVKTAIFEEDKMISNQTSNADFVQLIKDLVEENPNIKSIIISTVRASFDTDKIQFSEDIYRIVLNHETALPIQNRYESRETLGNDRLALAVGATVHFPLSNCLVIDSGTCLTMDVINDKNQFLGGTISPGIQLRLNSMHDGTANLPDIEFDHFIPDQIGKNTINGMKSGAVNGLLNEIRGTISTLNKEFDNLKVIITGGDAKLFDNELKSGIFADPNLVLRGLNKILLYNLANS